MARSPKPKADDLVVAITTFRRGGELIEEGWLYPSDHEVVQSRKELFVSFAGGRPAIEEALQELARLEREEEARQRALVAPPAPPARPSRVVATRRLLNPGVGWVEPGEIFRVSDQLVELAPDAFAVVQD